MIGSSVLGVQLFWIFVSMCSTTFNTLIIIFEGLSTLKTQKVVVRAKSSWWKSSPKKMMMRKHLEIVARWKVGEDDHPKESEITQWLYDKLTTHKNHINFIPFFPFSFIFHNLSSFLKFSNFFILRMPREKERELLIASMMSKERWWRLITRGIQDGGLHHLGRLLKTLGSML